ncbi:MAG: AAA family ATPase, partial [Candidatus Puniceispirillaceae bacterium]
MSLSVENFRNYAGCRLEIASPKVLLLGENGAGKTNLMEAISLLAPGRGLRRAKYEHLPRIGAPAPEWAVSARLLGGGAPGPLGAGISSAMDGSRRLMRRA